ncbi:hypothetical protein DL93DRAFT_1292897 [Clavulina sp. PMI_390]|nr:hypothetical protein DL93DRAFT_1292897 [Clavulina sp. PMI_390]
MGTLAKGTACYQCRKHKVKCDGSKPVCSRCLNRNTECVYPSRVAVRRPITQTLQARALELEAIVTKLNLASAHDLSLASLRLLERIGRLGRLPDRQQIPGQQVGRVSTSHVQTAVRQWPNPPEGFEELPLPLSLYLLSLFLPFRFHYFFFTDIEHFRHCVTLPSSDPDSIHPCLLNACYLGACVNKGESMLSLEPYFVRRTRHFLDQALMFADRITQFLWASVLLACYFGRRRRMEESFAVISAAARLALACGLGQPPGEDALGENLLPPPKNEAEAVDRIRLARSIYIADQSITLVSTYPMTFPGDRLQHGKGAAIRQEELLNLWQSSEQLLVSMMRLSEQVNKFARATYANNFRASYDEYVVLRDKISVYLGSMPPLPDVHGLSPPEAIRTFNSNILFAHATLHGAGMMLHSLRANYDLEARRLMFESMRALVHMCKKIQERRRIHVVPAGLASMVHVMNAVRVTAHELRRHKNNEKHRLSISYCQDIEISLDFLDA